MAEADHLQELKSAARKIARARRIKHVGALEVIAKALGYAHWNAITVTEKKGWRPSVGDIDAALALAESENPLISIAVDPEVAMPADSFRGEVMGRAYAISTDLDDVRVWGSGWEVILPEAPLAPARFKNIDCRIASNPIDEPDFRQVVLDIATEWRKRIHARIASDWPRRSTVPDSEGRAEHPLFNDVGTEWYCMHCDKSANSKEITANLFHCPHCLASPMDIHSSPWWRDEEEVA